MLAIIYDRESHRTYAIPPPVTATTRILDIRHSHGSGVGRACPAMVNPAALDIAFLGITPVMVTSPALAVALALPILLSPLVVVLRGRHFDLKVNREDVR